MRLQVIANHEMVAKLDYYCKMFSVSRSSLCAMLIGQGLMGFDKAYQIVDDLTPQLKEAALKELAEDDRRCSNCRRYGEGCEDVIRFCDEPCDNWKEA